MNFTVSTLATGFIFGVFGIYVFREGKKRQNLYLYIIGPTLLIYTYFTPNAWWDWGVGTGLLYLAYALRNS